MWGSGTGGNQWPPPPPVPPGMQQQVEGWSFNPNHYVDIPNNQGNS